MIRALIEEAIADFAAGLMEKARQSQRGITADDIQKVTSEHTLSEPQNALIAEIWQQCLNQADAAQWMESREFHLERMIVKGFSNLLPSGDQSFQKGKHLSRRIIPGVLAAFEQMLGEEKHEYFSLRANSLVQHAEESQEGRLSWNDLYDSPACTELVQDVLVYVAQYFSDIGKRRNWLIDVIDANLPQTSDENEKQWNFGDAEFHVLMNALFGGLREKLHREDTVAVLQTRYNTAELQSLETLFAGLIDDFKHLQKSGFV